MNKAKKQHVLGVTLIEILLVLVLIGIILYSMIGYMQQRAQAMRIDRASIYMQQILNAGLAYYVVNGTWPVSLTTLQTNNGYLPPGANLTNPWGLPYFAGPGQPPVTNPSLRTPPRVFYVWTAIPGGTGSEASVTAAQIAGALPLGYVTSTNARPPTQATACGQGTQCIAVGTVNVPGQNLNNANAVTFAGIYRQGACVPVPACPVDQNNTPLVPEILVAPVSVSGNNVNNTTAYPITSFTAYAVGNQPLDASPPRCFQSTEAPSCISNINGTPAVAYWRVCLKVITQWGDVQAGSNSQWGSNVALMAITRCAIPNEPAGSTFTVFGN